MFFPPERASFFILVNWIDQTLGEFVLTFTVWDGEVTDREADGAFQAPRGSGDSGAGVGEGLLVTGWQGLAL